MMMDWEAVPHIDQVRIIGALLLLVFERVLYPSSVSVYLGPQIC
jgi:hypothetical protein